MDDKTTEILKCAILMEKRGQAFYKKVAQQASGVVVKRFFEMMAEEENNHIKILSDQFKAYQNGQRFNINDMADDCQSDIASHILPKHIRSEISAADYEAAAISAAMSMEENAIKLYSERAVSATDPHEKALYDWLANWETQHLSFLADIDRDLTEDIWYDQNFWPF
ncbi:MAG: ferritin family protein [Deltaproteobacteria bacterium]|jgi:rubrerythrin|nr:ferritin family protein [Deltaproteobacteria bacterium]